MSSGGTSRAEKIIKMAIYCRTQGFFIKKTDRGEADRLFTIYTKDFGKLEILGKAVRKIKSKLRGGAELFYLSEVEFIQGKTYKTLTDAVLIEGFQNIRKDLKKLDTACSISEILDNLVKGQEPDKEIWDLLKEVFNKLNNDRPQTKNHKSLCYYFFWDILSLLGYRPELYYCSICQKKLIPDVFYFSPEEGGVICKNCFKKVEKADKINVDLIKTLRLLVNKDWKTLSRLRISSDSQKLLKDISRNYYSHLLERTR